MNHLYFFLLIVLFNVSRAQNNALNFLAGNDDVSLNYSSALDFDTSDKFTIETWVQTTESSAAIIWSNHVNVAPYRGTEVSIVGGKAVFEIFNDYQTNGIRVETITFVNDGNWHHIACVYKGIPTAANCEIYVDGAFQNLNVTTNNLSSSITSTNEVHIGSRDNTSYFSTLTLDEMRVWKRALCVSEIQARKNCSLNGNEPQLEAYYNFNHGMAGSSNPTITLLADLTGNGHNGTLSGFALNGASSNWIASTAAISGTCNAYSGLTISGTSTLCSGSSASLSVSGAQSYTWFPGNYTTSVISVTPSVTTTYSVNATTISSCQTGGSHTVTVVNCTGLNEQNADKTARIYPNPVQDILNVEGIKLESIQIYNNLGELVFREDLDEAIKLVDIGALSKGIYFVTVKANGQSGTKKLIKN